MDMRDFRTGLPFEEVLGPRLAGLPPIVQDARDQAQFMIDNKHLVRF